MRIQVLMEWCVRLHFVTKECTFVSFPNFNLLSFTIYNHKFIYSWSQPSITPVFNSDKLSCQDGTNLGSTLTFSYYGNRNMEVDQLEIFGATRFRSRFFTSEDGITDLANNTVAHNSYALTGTSSWTLFELPNCQGRHFCLAPYNDLLYNFSTDMQSSPPPLPFRIAKSVKKGCTKTSKLYVESTIPHLV